MVTLKARAERAVGRVAASLVTARDALAITEANAPEPHNSATVGAALMAIAEAERAAGNPTGAQESARRAAEALSRGLGPNHSETRAALAFR
jgi:hypothetical protein